MTTLSDQELLKGATLKSGNFPKNTVRPTTSRHHLDGYLKRLNSHDRRLFCDDGKASVDLWDYDEYAKEFQNTCVSNEFELMTRLEGEHLFVRDDPRCRFIFIHAFNSRECLRTSRRMFERALTHHQVMPNFLDFVFPFGHQQYAEDLLFSGFREDTRLVPSDGGLVIPELGRSGMEIRICYSLKSVEPKERDQDFPWSIRQTAVYHSFDLKTGKSCWIVIKGSHLIRDRVRSVSSSSAASDSSSSELSSFESISSSLGSALEMHLVLCDWCDEDWRWYLTFLEKELQRLTRRALVVDIPKARSFVEPETFQEVKPHAKSITRTLSDYTKRTLSLSRKQTNSSSSMEKGEYQPSFPQPPMSPLDEGPPLDPPVLPPGMGSIGIPAIHQKAQKDEVFSVRTLQQVQVIEDKTNEVLLILEANIKIVKDIRRHYQTVLASDECPPKLKSESKSKVAYFEKRIANIIGDLEIQHSSAQTLLRLLENRKSILSGLLNISNIEASKEFATNSQHSASKMHAMTEAMHLLAVKTKQETVSMRVITLVTLFFLPGTFISTVMSTDIIKFPSQQESGQVFQLGALRLWLIITLPLMAITFIAWWLVYWYVNRRQDQQGGGSFRRWLP
ncbi:hypothetical protein BKA65DRAFT_517421 [Rhexocercosporidium sp. MPI-PUGE-AT-0058]|nr:hypothetical protein BKA65DRAFT_517421 [Rhexocercosporidium sp. MPI-PUGE-AT-0058]